jgi:LmbE family N-acetylglucosaminyl deacetylase
MPRTWTRALGWVTAACLQPLLGAEAPRALPELAGPGASDRVLVIAPHPDDESLCCGGLIRRTLDNGGSVAIVWITSGDAFELDAFVVEHTLRPHAGVERLALTRMTEARSAAARLGVADANLYFLGYPDRGIRRLLLDHYDVAYRSHYTQTDHVPYAGTLAQGSAYTGANLTRDLAAVMDRYRPTLVLAPSPEDLHPDHRATGELAIRVLAQRHRLDSARYWIVHGGTKWPTPRALRPDLWQTPPPVAPKLSWQQLTLSDAEQQAKLSALREHHSQLKVMNKRMLSFVRRDELYSLTALPE